MNDTQTETVETPKLTPEQQAYVNRVMAARALSQDFVNILARTNVAPDVSIIVGFGIVTAGLIALKKFNPDEAQAAVGVLAADFEGLVSALGLAMDGAYDEAPQAPAGAATN